MKAGEGSGSGMRLALPLTALLLVHCHPGESGHAGNRSLVDRFEWPYAGTVKTYRVTYGNWGNPQELAPTTVTVTAWSPVGFMIQDDQGHSEWVDTSGGGEDSFVGLLPADAPTDSLESVTVPAGTYPALHVEYTLPLSNHGPQSVHYWWAEGVGLVRKDMPGAFICGSACITRWELTSFLPGPIPTGALDGAPGPTEARPNSPGLGPRAP